ncbi:unnamed protein product [Diamesa serratosioi]
MNKSHYDIESKVWSGPNYPVIYDKNVSLGHLILSVLSKTPEEITQVSADTNVELTCYEMRLRAIRIAKSLSKLGYKKGDIVGVMARNTENLAPLVFAFFTLGLPINSLAPTFTKSDVIQLFSTTKPSLIFCDSDLINIMQDAIDEIGIKSNIYSLINKVNGYNFVGDLMMESVDDDNFIAPDLGDVSLLPALILCSSGTTGLPKGVCKSHSQVIQQHLPFWQCSSRNRDILFNFSTIYWATGIIFQTVGTLYGSKRIITSQSFDPELMIDIVNKYKVTTTLLLPSLLSSVLQCDKIKPLPSVKVLMCGGSVVSKELCERASPYFPNGIIASVYGTSEADFVTIAFPNVKHGSTGQVCANVKVKILDDDGKCQGPDEEGEICFQTPVSFLGYYNNPLQTKEILDDDGWMHSGDIGKFDNEGNLIIVDRKKDILKYLGYQVSPSEIENIINKIDGVATSCVVGVCNKNSDDIIYAFVVPSKKQNHLKEIDVLNVVNDQVSEVKRIRGGVHFVDNLPMTASGKILRNLMRNVAKNMFTE